MVIYYNDLKKIHKLAFEVLASFNDDDKKRIITPLHPD
jgi:hypothetical protein